jgi:S1-C subfamily serine protease
LTVDTQDAYGRPARRSITPLRGLVRPGNSGGPMVDPTGRVDATVFAAITGTVGGFGQAPGPGGFAVPDAIVRADLAQARGAAVGTGSCAG